MAEKKELRWWQYAVFYGVFWLVWAAFTLYGKPAVGRLAPWVAEIVSEAVKCLLWILPALWMIRRYPDALGVSLEEMTAPKFPFRKVAPWLACMILVPLASAFRAGGGIRIAPGFHWYSLIGGFLTVGITEELVFRGWLYNATLKKLPTGYAELLNAVLFLLIHIPIWMLHGALVSNLLSGKWITIVALSWLFCWIFRETKCLWAPVILHMAWDVMVTVFVG